MPDVFISYSRKDKTFVEKLVKKLEEKGRDVWVDFEDIPFAAEWWDAIQDGIETSPSAVFVLSPDYLASEVCGLEVNHVQKNNKRIIPIVYHKPERDKVPSTLAELNWIFFDDADAFDDSFTKLQTTLDTNLHEMRLHTRLLLKARDWEKGGQSTSLLLRGEELLELEKLLTRSDVTDLMRRFVVTSQERRRVEEMTLRFIWGFFGGLLGIAFWAFSTFRSVNLFTPSRIIYTIALGQVFGLCLGVMSALADDLPTRVLRWIPSHQLRIVLRTLLFVGIGVFAWTSYLWFLEQLGTTQQDTNSTLLGGIALAIPFVTRSLISKTINQRLLFPLSNFITLLCSLVLFIAFLLMEWLYIAADDTSFTGINLLSTGIQDAVQVMPTLLLIPVAAVISAVAGVWALRSPKARQQATRLALIAGLIGMAHYLILFLQIRDTYAETSELLGLGFWTGLFASFGLITQYFIQSMPGLGYSLLTTALIWIPINITYNDDYVDFIPLIYFDNPVHLLNIGLPLALLMAIGANFQALQTEIRALYRQKFDKPSSSNEVL